MKGTEKTDGFYKEDEDGKGVPHHHSEVGVDGIGWEVFFVDGYDGVEDEKHYAWEDDAT